MSAAIIAALLLCCMPILARNVRPPRLTVVIVVDQFAHHYIDKLYPYLKYGLRYLIDHSVYYTNANWHSGQPGTAGGHASLNTGVCANYHGYVSNTWYENGEKTPCDKDDSGNANVISPDGVYDFGKSAQHLMVDGLSDQCVLQTEPGSKFVSYSISGKSRSAIATASKLGKPLWIDACAGTFTSSKAYFDTLPTWVQRFNKGHNIADMGTLTWKKMYPENPYAYRFFNIDNYEYTRRKETMLNTPLPAFDESNEDNPCHLFEKTPYANQLLLDCSLECIKQHVSRKHKDRLLLWVCLSPLDKVGHQFGPNSLEAIDMIYHLDKQLRRFIRKTLRVIGKHELVFALTADHGIMPIPELLHQQGLTQAQRLDRVEFISEINKNIEEKHSLQNMVVSYKGQGLTFDETQLNELDPEQQAAIINNVKTQVLQSPVIKNAWTIDELINLPTLSNSLEENIKSQIFKGRSGSLIIQPYPYTLLTHWPEGASHKTPYNYDTHVPLMIFYPGKFERKYVRQRVCPMQLPSTLAEILNIPKPSASTCEILPELFDPEYK